MNNKIQWTSYFRHITHACCNIEMTNNVHRKADEESNSKACQECFDFLELFRCLFHYDTCLEVSY